MEYARLRNLRSVHPEARLFFFFFVVISRRFFNLNTTFERSFVGYTENGESKRVFPFYTECEYGRNRGRRNRIDGCCTLWQSGEEEGTQIRDVIPTMLIYLVGIVGKFNRSEPTRCVACVMKTCNFSIFFYFIFLILTKARIHCYVIAINSCAFYRLRFFKIQFGTNYSYRMSRIGN